MANRQAIQVQGRQLQALELRKAGVSYEAIAASLGYRDRSGAYRAVTAALKLTLREPAEELRTLELERLDAMLLALWRRVQAGDEKTVDRVLHIMERRARLLGLDAPLRSEFNGSFSAPFDLHAEAIAAVEFIEAACDRLVEQQPVAAELPPHSHSEGDA